MGLFEIDEGEDRRVRRVAITPAGDEAARRAYPFWKKAQNAALAAAALSSSRTLICRCIYTEKEKAACFRDSIDDWTDR